MVLCFLSDMRHASNRILHTYCRNVTRHTSNDDVNDAFIIVESFCAEFDIDFAHCFAVRLDVAVAAFLPCL